MTDLTGQQVVRSGYDAIGERYHQWSHRSETRLRFVREVLDRLPARRKPVNSSG